MNLLKQLVRNLFPDNTPTQEPQRHDSYNQVWVLWLRHFNGDLQQLTEKLQQTDSTLSPLEAQEVLAKIREETKWAMSQFYDVRDGKQTREQATRNIQMHLPDLNNDNLNSLVSYCQYSSER